MQKNNNFSTLILYQLNKVNKQYSLTHPRKKNILAQFISKAKTNYKMKYIATSVKSAHFFTNKIDVCNATQNKSEEKIDIYNMNIGTPKFL